MSGIVTTASLVLDATGVNQLAGHGFIWQWWALGGWIAFVLFIGLEIYGLHSEINRIKATRPIPQVIARVINNEAILEVHNNGATASFKATTRIIGGAKNDYFYDLQWNPASALNKGDMARIRLAGIPSKFLVLYDNDGQPFMYLSQEEIDKHTLKERYPKSYLDMSKGIEPPEDKCILEVMITSSPSPIEPVNPRQYILGKDTQGNLIFTEIVSNADKGDSQKQ